METEGIKVFVYGTLKSGHGNNYALKDAEFLGRCFIEGEYTLVDLSWYPGLVKVGAEGSKVFGEVYRIDESTLNSLDAIEGHPDFYCREKVNTPWKKAWTYFLPDEYIEEHDVVEDGCWEPATPDEEAYHARYK